MAETRLSALHGIFRPWYVKAGTALALLLAFINGYAGVEDQFPSLPKLQDVVAMTHVGILPWWGWLLVLQGVFTYALFEYVRVSIPSAKGGGGTSEGSPHGTEVPPAPAFIADSSPVDKATKRLAGMVQQICEEALQDPNFSWPYNRATLGSMNYNDLTSSMHLIWTDEPGKTLRREFTRDLKQLAYKMEDYRRHKGPDGKKEAGEAGLALEKTTDALVALLKG